MCPDVNAVAVVKAVCDFAGTATFDDLAEVYGANRMDAARSHYLLGKMTLMQRDLRSFIGQLDNRNLNRFIRLAVQRARTG